MDTPLTLSISERNFHLTFDVGLGPLIVRGTFRELHGTLHVPTGDIDDAQLVVHVAAASISTGLSTRDRHLRGGSFLDAANFPLISFRSTRVHRVEGALQVDGLLTLRGVERTIHSHCPLDHLAHGTPSEMLSLCGMITVPRLLYGVGVPRGLDVLNPIFLLVGREVRVRADLRVPAGVALV